MTTKILWSIAVLFIALVLVRLFKSFIKRLARKKNVSIERGYYISKVFDIFFIIAVLIVIALVWSVDIKGISVVASSVFAIIGVAMFAQWSILSNVTASIIIFFIFPAKVGDRIRILDGDDSLEGVIKEITLFQMELKNDDGSTVLYPNNLILQRPVIKLNK